jgi:valyl-tRNA synthetase
MMQWILSRMNGAARAINEALERFDLSTATSAAHAFWCAGPETSLCRIGGR